MRKAVQDYLPYLYAIMRSIDADSLLLNHEPCTRTQLVVRVAAGAHAYAVAFSWRPVLSQQLRSTRSTLPSLSVTGSDDNVNNELRVPLQALRISILSLDSSQRAQQLCI